MTGQFNLSGKIKMTLNEVAPRVELEEYYSQSIIFDDISTNTQSSTKELNIGDKDFLCIMPVVSVIDADGQDVNYNDAARDLILFSFESQDGKKFQSDPVDIYTLNKLVFNNMFKGILLKNRTKYTFKIEMAAFPASAKFTTKLKVRISLQGYQLKKV